MRTLKGQGLNCFDQTQVASANALNAQFKDESSPYAQDGTPFEQVLTLFENKTLRSGTVCFYTFIFQSFMYGCPTIIQNKYGFRNAYKPFRSFFNSIVINFFYDILYDYGITQVREYQINQAYKKHYGYFVIP